MRFSTFCRLHEEATQTTEELFIAERGWQGWMEKYEDNICSVLMEIYKISNMSILDVRKMYGIKRTELSRIARTSYRSIERWESGERQIPYQMMLLLKFAMFLEYFLETEEMEDE